MLKRVLDRLTNLAAEDMAPGEEIKFSTKRAWYSEGLLVIVSAFSAVMAVALLVYSYMNHLTGFIAVAANILAGLCLFSGVLFSLNALLTQYSIRYFLTNLRIIKRTGVFTKKLTSIEYDKIQNIRIEKSITERLVDMGDIYIDTAGSPGPEMVIEGIPDPEAMHRMILENTEKGRR